MGFSRFLCDFASNFLLYDFLGGETLTPASIVHGPLPAVVSIGGTFDKEGSSDVKS